MKSLRMVRGAMLLLLACTFTVIAVGQGRASDETAWFRDFIEWAASLPADVAPARIEPMYKEHLASQGLAPGTIEQHWSSIKEQQREAKNGFGWPRTGIIRTAGTTGSRQASSWSIS